MARKTAAEKRQEALDAETTLNTTAGGILVRSGQMWQDLNPRNPGRVIAIAAVEAGIAQIIDGNRKGKLAVANMREGSRGYKI
jgi:hypothetical protein